MNEEMKPAVVLENPEAHARAYFLRDDTKARLSVIESNYYAVCNNIKEMRDGKLYKQLGYQNFEDCCKSEFEIKKVQAYKYISIAERLSEDFVQSTVQIGTEKLSLLAMLDEPTREAVTETVDVESVTVKELREQISRIESENADLGQKLDAANESLSSKSKQFKEAMDAKDKQLKAVKESGEHSLSECKTFLNGKIHELEARIQELQDQPITHDMTDADAAEEIKRLQRELEDERLKYTIMEGGAEAKARRAADAVRQEYEKKLAEVQTAERESIPDTKDVFKAYLANAADSMARLLTYLESIKTDANMPLYVSKVDGIVEMTQSRRNAL